ncbi:hypothetical protein ABZS68_30210 [Streptomyces sp. NPDC005571]|uniref:hypothetical protein n=1 Tax=Streptomyces sp. NPDC005571 TaxID=3156888 RepID=UPI0033BDB9D6
MQQPVAGFLGFGSGEFTVQQEDASPGEEIDRCAAEFEPAGVDIEVAVGEAAEAGALAAPDVVFEGGVSAKADTVQHAANTVGLDSVIRAFGSEFSCWRTYSEPMKPAPPVARMRRFFDLLAPASRTGPPGHPVRAPPTLFTLVLSFTAVA